MRPFYKLFYPKFFWIFWREPRGHFYSFMGQVTLKHKSSKSLLFVWTKFGYLCILGLRGGCKNLFLPTYYHRPQKNCNRLQKQHRTLNVFCLTCQFFAHGPFVSEIASWIMLAVFNGVLQIGSCYYYGLQKNPEQIFSQGPIFVKYVALHCTLQIFFYVSGKVIVSFLNP